MTVPTATATRRIDERTGTGSGRLRALVVELGAGVLKYRASSRDAFGGVARQYARNDSRWSRCSKLKRAALGTRYVNETWRWRPGPVENATEDPSRGIERIAGILKAKHPASGFLRELTLALAFSSPSTVTLSIETYEAVHNLEELFWLLQLKQMTTPWKNCDLAVRNASSDFF